MPPKRTVEDGETSGTPSTSSTAADMATLIRTELLTGLDSARKKRRVRSSGTTNVNTIDPTPCTSLLFKLPREIRDQIYQLLWIETPRIRQRYKRRSYPITYGALTLAEQHHISTEKVPWLLTNKQILLEGLTAFHKRSVWIFEASPGFMRTEYVFPLLTPVLVSEQHLFIKGKLDTRRSMNSRYMLPFSRHEYEEGEGSSKIVWNVLTPRNDTMELANIMTTTAEPEGRVQKIKLHIQMWQLGFRNEEHTGFLPNVVWDLSKLERLAVHRNLRTFEVRFQMPRVFNSHPEAEHMKMAVANLMDELELVAKALLPDGIIESGTFLGSWDEPGPPGSFEMIARKA